MKTATDGNIDLSCSEVANGEKITIEVCSSLECLEIQVDRGKAQEFAYNILRSIQYGKL